jgi:hypothetical protein
LETGNDGSSVDECVGPHRDFQGFPCLGEAGLISPYGGFDEFIE